jgi:hypothetical protein
LHYGSADVRVAADAAVYMQSFPVQVPPCAWHWQASVVHLVGGTQALCQLLQVVPVGQHWFELHE